MKKLLKGFGNTKQDICNAMRTISTFAPEKQQKVFGAMMKTADEQGHLVAEGATTTPEEFEAAAQKMKTEFIASVGADGTFESLFEPQ